MVDDSALSTRLPRGEDALDLDDDVVRRIVQVGAHAVTELRVGLGVPRRPARVGDELVDRAGDAVCEQRRHASVRVAAEHELALRREPPCDLRDRRRQVEEQQPPGAERHGALLLGWCVEQAYGDGVAGVHE